MDLDAIGLVKIDQQHAQTLATPLLRIGAGQQDHPVGVHGMAGPDLAAVDDVLLSIADRRRVQVRQVGASVRLAVALTPHLLHAGDLAEVAVLLLLGPQRQEYRAQHVQPVGVADADPAVGHLLADQHLVHRRQAPAAVLLGPVWHQPPVVEQLLVVLAAPLVLLVATPLWRRVALPLTRKGLVQIALQLGEHLSLLVGELESRRQAGHSSATTFECRAPVRIARSGWHHPVTQSHPGRVSWSSESEEGARWATGLPA